jgi:non-ribosomal peptide synthetase component E (peptide arylation enzyme)
MSAIAELIPGWPALRAMRWSDEQAADFYATGRWGEGCDRLLADHAARTPDRLAVTDGAMSLTWGELDRSARGLAASLLSAGLHTGDVALVRMANSTDHVLALYGLAAAGLVAYELPADTSDQHVAEAAQRTRAGALLADTAIADDLDVALVVDSAAALRGFAASEAAVRLPGQDPDAVSTLIGTSGTTGSPKIVMRTANGSLAMARSVIERSGLSGSDVLLTAAPLQGGVGWINAIGSVLLTGCTLVIPHGLDPETLLGLIERHRVTRIATLPTIANRMLGSAAFRPETVQTVEVLQTGGAFLAPDHARALERAFGCRTIVVYGAIDVGAPTMVSTDDADELRHTTLGRVCHGAELAVLGPGGEHLDAGETGELAMRGPDTALGYFDDDEATAMVYDADGWGRMGDLGALDADGYLRLTGRVKEIINRGGKKISIAEVEGAVAAVEGVRDVAAVGYPDPDLGERCAVFLVGDPGLGLDLLRERLTQRQVPKTIWPERVELIDALPVAVSGKVDRAALRALLAARQRAPPTPVSG